MKNMLKEFRTFIQKGNVMDLAVGVIMGSAFGAIVNSLVNDVLMPALGVLIGGIDFSGLTIKFKDATISYGLFIQNVINFLIMALVLFILLKIVNGIMEAGKKKKTEETPAVVKSDETILLEEIRDLLKKKK